MKTYAQSDISDFFKVSLGRDGQTVSESNNIFLLNPSLVEKEVKDLTQLKEAFEARFGSIGFILLSSSGTSRGPAESLKLIALSKEALFLAAKRVNQYFEISSKDVWGLYLPTFHIAGLSILARAYQSGFSALPSEKPILTTTPKVIELKWSVETFIEDINNNKISVISLVPTQIYDLIHHQIPCPKGLMKIFIGTGVLQKAQREELMNLGYRCYETFGLTETLAMFSVLDHDDYFKTLPGVKIRELNQHLVVQTDSLAHSVWQIRNEIVYNETIDSTTGYIGSDLVEIHTEDATLFRFLGRADEMIKILGYGVSISELSSVFEKVLLENQLSSLDAVVISRPHEKNQSQIQLVFQKPIDHRLACALAEQFNRLVRPYERVSQFYLISKIPRSNLNKLLKVQLIQTLANTKEHLL